MLRVSGLSVRYGGRAAVVDASLGVADGKVGALIGPNGAGKTSIVRAVTGLHPASLGSVILDGTDITKWPRHKRARAGIGLVPEGRRVFASLTVKENLLVPLGKKSGENDVDFALELFPALRECLDRRAGVLSGGQQQMLAVARALVLKPTVLVLDEPTMGLAPFVVDDVMNVVRSVAREGTAVLIADESARKVTDVADHVYVMRAGSIVHDFAGGTNVSDQDLVEAYFK